ncbi:MAG: hypothetical protein RIR77_1808 [Planctomycetota bacterium]|jgi:MYXO-CTERM domain-containing protein
MRISNRFEKHIAAAAAVAMGATAAANAAVVYSGVLNFVCAPNTDGVYINVETPTVTNEYFDSYQLNAYSNNGFRFYFSASGGGLMRREGVTTGTGGNLALGTSIGSTGSYNSTDGDVYGTTSAEGLLGGWTYSSENIVGFKFKAADTLIHYGWMRFAMGAEDGVVNTMTRTLVDYGYESTAGASILAGAGAVPAPGALALLGVAGLAGGRRRRA